MIGNRFSRLLAIGGAGLLFTFCSDQSSAPTELSTDGLSGHSSHLASDPAALELEPFTFRATLDPYRINQPPDFMIHSRARSDFIIQRSAFSGVGGWHTHPGLSYAFVIQGQIKLQKFTKKNGCFETRVFGPGEVYLKPADEVHRAVVVGEAEEVELIVRLNFPEGGPIAEAAPDPGCPTP